MAKEKALVKISVKSDSYQALVGTAFCGIHSGKLKNLSNHGPF